ncbi:unknown [Clostridium sp. CAG:813]|nr:unknown [Clostridium sp. CAG:813]
MRKLVIFLGIIGIIAQPALATEDGEIHLGTVEQAKIELPKVDYKGKDSLIINEQQIMDEIVKLQKEKDMEDIDNLWKGTVENNQVIGFALKKLATPESQRRIHSSLMAKTLSAIVSGASLAPALVGADYMVQSGSYAAGRIAQNLLNKKNIPQEIPLTDTELIELAGLVENLQDKIINAYYNYKGCLSQLKEIRSRELLYSRNYAKAMDEEDFLEISISSALYDDMQIEEAKYVQMSKKYHLELQRLAGKKVVENLNLYQYNYDSALIGGDKDAK